MRGDASVDGVSIEAKTSEGKSTINQYKSNLSISVRNDESKEGVLGEIPRVSNRGDSALLICSSSTISKPDPSSSLFSDPSPIINLCLFLGIICCPGLWPPLPLPSCPPLFPKTLAKNFRIRLIVSWWALWRSRAVIASCHKCWFDDLSSFRSAEMVC